MSFFFGGIRRKEQFFNQTVGQTAASLLALSVGSLIIPTCFQLFGKPRASAVASISRGTAIILLVVYAGYLTFQLRTHSDVFNEESQKVARKPRKRALPEGAIAKGLVKVGGVGAGPGRVHLDDRPQDELINSEALDDAEDEAEQGTLHIGVAWATLIGATAIIGVCSGIFPRLLLKGDFLICALQNSWSTGFPQLLTMVYLSNLSA
jgi:Ca2+:H+ antiporter